MTWNRIFEHGSIGIRALVLAALICPFLIHGVGWAASSGDAAAPTALSVSDREAIRAVIKEQLDAFQRDDASTAFALAAPSIQQTFHSAERFLFMVKRGYQAVYRHALVEFREIRDIENLGPVQSVYVEGQDGESVIALYPMERQPDGSWRINGCHLVHSDERQI